MKVARSIAMFVYTYTHMHTCCQMSENWNFQAHSSSRLGNIYGVQSHIFSSTDQFTLVQMPHRCAATLNTYWPDLGNVFCASVTAVNHMWGTAAVLCPHLHSTRHNASFWIKDFHNSCLYATTTYTTNSSTVIRFGTVTPRHSRIVCKLKTSLSHIIVGDWGKLLTLILVI